MAGQAVTRDTDTKALTEALLDTLEDIRAGMLGVSGSGQHMQPMTHFLDRKTHTLWFITSRETDLVRAVGTGDRAHFTLMDEDEGFYACMSGTIRQSDDRAKLEELWSPMVSAWFEGGPEDPDAVLLHMALTEAAVWRNTAGALKFGVEMARALARSDKQPDIGEHAVVPLGIAA